MGGWRSEWVRERKAWNWAGGLQRGRPRGGGIGLWQGEFKGHRRGSSRSPGAGYRVLGMQGGWG